MLWHPPIDSIHSQQGFKVTRALFRSRRSNPFPPKNSVFLPRSGGFLLLQKESRATIGDLKSQLELAQEQVSALEVSYLTVRHLLTQSCLKLSFLSSSNASPSVSQRLLLGMRKLIQVEEELKQANATEIEKLTKQLSFKDQELQGAHRSRLCQ